MDVIADIILSWSESVSNDQASRARLSAGEKVSEP